MNLNLLSLIASILTVAIFSEIFFPKDVVFSAKIGDYQTKESVLNENNLDVSIWQIEIPKINLKADISEGTESNILDKFVGHFNETAKENGNIGLAAHNRGYPVNYFENIKDLEIGDEIYYTYNGKKEVYNVNLKTIIKETDWKYLEKTDDKIITLITCVENEPEYRRCIQAEYCKN